MAVAEFGPLPAKCVVMVARVQRCVVGEDVYDCREVLIKV